MRGCWLIVCVGCVGDTTVGPDDSGTDSSTSTDATLDAPKNDAFADASDGGDGNVPFCASAATTSAAFCADFETVLNAGDNWDGTTTTAGSLTLDSTIAAGGSTRSALLAMTNASTSQVTLTKTVHATSLKSKLLIDFDAYFAFPSWNGTTDQDEFMTFVLSTTSVSGQYAIDVQRSVQWQTTNAGGATKTFPNLTPSAWHHFTISYNGSVVPVAFNITIDNNVAVNTTLPQFGTSAPTSFDTVLLNANAQSLNTTPATTVHYDNVVVRFP